MADNDTFAAQPPARTRQWPGRRCESREPAARRHCAQSPSGASGARVALAAASAVDPGGSAGRGDPLRRRRLRRGFGRSESLNR